MDQQARRPWSLRAGVHRLTASCSVATDHHCLAAKPLRCGSCGHRQPFAPEAIARARPTGRMARAGRQSKGRRNAGLWRPDADRLDDLRVRRVRSRPATTTATASPRRTPLVDHCGEVPRVGNGSLTGSEHHRSRLGDPWCCVSKGGRGRHRFPSLPVTAFFVPT